MSVVLENILLLSIRWWGRSYQFYSAVCSVCYYVSSVLQGKKGTFRSQMSLSLHDQLSQLQTSIQMASLHWICISLLWSVTPTVLSAGWYNKEFPTFVVPVYGYIVHAESKTSVRVACENVFRLYSGFNFFFSSSPEVGFCISCCSCNCRRVHEKVLICHCSF